MKYPFIIAFMVLLAWIPRTFLYPGVVRKYTQIDIPILTLLLVFSVAVWRFRHSILRHEALFQRRMVLYVALMLQILGICMSIVEYNTYPNFIFSRIHIHYQSVFIEGIYLFALSLLFLSNENIRKHWKYIVFFFPLYVLVVSFVINSWPFNYMYGIIKEDSVLGYTQVLFLCISGFISLRLTAVMKSWKRVLFFLGAVGLFFVAGEEISWGQRLLSIPTTGFFLENNIQGEITIHNLSQVKYAYIIYAYIIAGCVFTAAPLLEKWITRKFSLQHVVRFVWPTWFTVFFFYPIMVFNVYVIHFPHAIGNLAEVTELLLYMGIAIHFLVIWYRNKNLNKAAV